MRQRAAGRPGGAGPYPSTKRFVDLLFGKDGAWAYLADFSAPVTMAPTDVDAGPAGGGPRTLLEEDGLKISAIAGHHDDAPAVIYRVDYKGRGVVFTGDIDPAGLDNLRRIAGGCDLLVFNAVVLDPPGSPTILYSLHTPPGKIGEAAAAAHAGARQSTGRATTSSRRSAGITRGQSRSQATACV